MKKFIFISLVSALLVGCGQDTTKDIKPSKDTQFQAQSSNGWEYKYKGSDIASIENIALNRIKVTFSHPEHGATEDSWEIFVPGPDDGGKPERIKIPAKDSTYAEISSDLYIRHGQGLHPLRISALNPDTILMRRRESLNVFQGKEFSQSAGDKLFLGGKHLDKTMKGKPAIASGNPNRLDVFIRGTDDKLWTRSSTDNGKTWDSWVDLGGILASDPTVISGGPNHLDVHVRGHDNQLWHRWWNGSTWSGWESLGGILKSGPSAAARGNKVDVVAYGVEGDLWRKTWTGSFWTKWIRLGPGPKGNYSTYRPYIGHTSDYNLEVFAYGSAPKPTADTYSRWKGVYHKTFIVD